MRGNGGDRNTIMICQNCDTGIAWFNEMQLRGDKKARNAMRESGREPGSVDSLGEEMLKAVYTCLCQLCSCSFRRTALLTRFDLNEHHIPRSF